MKKIILTLLFACLSVASHAQTEHLKFKGIPIDGPIEEFEKQLLKEGFSKNAKGEIVGRFAGYDNANIIGVTNNDGIVYRVAVVYFLNEWKLLENRYSSLKSMLTTKYGTPQINDEEFKEFERTSDLNKLIALKTGNCNYLAAYKPDNGSIWLTLQYISFKSAVVLIYEDDINAAHHQQQAIDDL